MKLRNKKDNEFYKRCDEILHYVWDSIGVKDIPGARDEYRGYLPQVFRLVKEGADQIKIAEYLDRTQKSEIGLLSNLPENLKMARVLLDWKATIYQ